MEHIKVDFKVSFECPFCKRNVEVAAGSLLVDPYPCDCGCGQAWCNITVECPSCGKQITLYDSDPY